MNPSCIIIGGGAAGLAAATRLAGAGLPFVLLEKLDRVGKKILSTGNGRCNYSNRDLTPAHYGLSSEFVSGVWKSCPPEKVWDYLSSLGLLSCEEDGRLYPRTLSAASMLDILRFPLASEEGAICLGAQAEHIKRAGKGWTVVTAQGRAFSAPAVLVCAGGCAAPKLGSDGSGFRLLKDLGHHILTPVPSLVQLKCTSAALPSLKGIRTHARVTLIVNSRPAAAEEGELLFTDYGVSGICVFQLSGLAARALEKGQPVRLSVDLLPEIPAGSSSDAWLEQRLRLFSRLDVAAVFTGVLPRMLGQAVLREAGISLRQSVKDLNRDQCRALLSALHAFSLPVCGTKGFENAQVTSGGVLTEEVDPATMESRLNPGLYLAGEVLNVDGPCGGYNLHFAFASGLCAANAILRRND